MNWDIQKCSERMSAVLEVMSLNATAALFKAMHPTSLSLVNHEMWTLHGYMLYRINYKRENSSLDM